MADVSRETPSSGEPDPAVLSAVFAPSRLPALERYAELLASEGVLRGLIGPREVPRLWDRHLVNCGLLAPLVPHGARVADLGSGAGLPGLVLALARPDLAVTLVEPMARRVEFLTEACVRLGAENATVLRGRAEDLADRHGFDVVTSRALAPLTRLLAWSLPWVAPGGAVLALKGSSATEEIEAAGPELRRWRAAAEVVVCEVPGASATTVVRVVAGPGARIGWPASSTPHGGRGGHR
jgi:16S rRNA (guanine527-N7)-methyltransferase